MMKVILCLLFYFLCSSVPAKANVIDITIEKDIYLYAVEIINDQPILEVDNFSGKNSQRDVVEVILVQQALLLGGFQGSFRFDLGFYDAANIALLEKGLLLISFDSIWLSTAQKISKKVYISDPIVRKGQYMAGIYTSLTNTKALKTTSLAQFKKLSVVSSTDWPVDWKTLTDIAPQHLANQREWNGMARLVHNKWVDVTLAPFRATLPYLYSGKNYEIIAIEGIKIALDDSRHFIVSKKHPRGKEAFIALQKGLKILRKSGTITKAYKQSGFFNEETQHWTVLNAELLKTQ
jgi:hypothetical protein